MAKKISKRSKTAVKKAAPARKRSKVATPPPRAKKRRAAAPKAKRPPRQTVAKPVPVDLERIWTEHIAGEFTTKDVEVTLATMVDDASVDHVPVHSGGRGKEQLRVFYRDVFIPSWPEDLQMTLLNRVIGENQLVEELRLRFTHSKPMNWFLPQVPPTNRPVDIDMVVVVQFRGDKLACERIYWDHASVLRQVGLLQVAQPNPSPSTGSPDATFAGH
jgi:carboxymethylenebutenolidase